mmetsp:Transcript_100468/g.169743  ORF Transcript_100468/g.169743 Transcript_100468/m.169743 type:complete len:264 (-) Transcript_100468:653-1444(-)
MTTQRLCQPLKTEGLDFQRNAEQTTGATSCSSCLLSVMGMGSAKGEHRFRGLGCLERFEVLPTWGSCRGVRRPLEGVTGALRHDCEGQGLKRGVPTLSSERDLEAMHVRPDEGLAEALLPLPVSTLNCDWDLSLGLELRASSHIHLSLSALKLRLSASGVRLMGHEVLRLRGDLSSSTANGSRLAVKTRMISSSVRRLGSAGPGPSGSRVKSTTRCITTSANPRDLTRFSDVRRNVTFAETVSARNARVFCRMNWGGVEGTTM